MRTDDPVVGEERSFAEFFAREYRNVVGLAFVLCGFLDGAEDLAQDAFAAAYRDWPRISRTTTRPRGSGASSLIARSRYDAAVRPKPSSGRA